MDSPALSPEVLAWVDRAVVAADMVAEGLGRGAAERLEVLAYRDSLEGKAREDFEGRVVMRIGAPRANSFFGYVSKRAIKATMAIENGSAAKAMEFNHLMHKSEKARAERKPRRVMVLDWLQATTAAVLGAKT